MKILNMGNKRVASEYAAIEIIKQIKAHPQTTLGLATGDTMLEVYPDLNELINLNQTDLSEVHTFNLDEYVGLGEGDKDSYHTYMHENLFNHNSSWVAENIHVPNGKAEDISQEIKDYEAQLEAEGPVDIQLLGIGENGHIGFNEPGASFESKTRVVDLTESTINANKVHFERTEDMPTQAISMGLGSIMSAKRIILLAFGDKKANAIQQLIEGKVSEALPASILHQHDNVEILVDDTIYQQLDWSKQQ